jgi:hypothetical protein
MWPEADVAPKRRYEQCGGTADVQPDKQRDMTERRAATARQLIWIISQGDAARLPPTWYGRFCTRMPLAARPRSCHVVLAIIVGALQSSPAKV